MRKIKYKLLTILCLSSLVNSEMLRHSSIPDVVLDTDTNLIWQDNEDAKIIKKNLTNAMNYCETLTLLGVKDWYLPDIDTLKNLYLHKTTLQNLYVGYDSYHWSRTGYLSSGYGYCNSYINFKDGSTANSCEERGYEMLIRCVTNNHFDTLTFSLFLKSLKVLNRTSNSIELASNYGSEFKLFLIKKDGKKYFGTKKELLKQFGIKLEDSKTPFDDIQKLTQQKLNDYLTIPTISQPTLPVPLNLVKDEFESKAEFNKRVAEETSKREAEIQKLQDEFRAKVEQRNKELEKRKANIEIKKKEFLFESLALVMGNPKLSNPVFDAETNTMFVDVVMDGAEWKKKIAITIEDRQEAKNFKNSIEKIDAKVTFGYENDELVLQDIKIQNPDEMVLNLQDIEKEVPEQIERTKIVKGFFADKEEKYFETVIVKKILKENVQIPKIYTATLDRTDFKPEKVAVTIENKKVAFNELQNPNLVDKYQVSALGYGESNQAKGLKYNDDLAPLLKNMKVEKPNPKNWLFAVAIENYDEADAVIYAKNSATSLITAMQKRLGISERNTYALIDEKATGGAIKGQLERLLENVKEGDNVYFYYSGHGIPSSENGEAFILPKDVIADYVTKEKEFMARNIYKKLSDSKAGKVVALIDSCYSGKTDGISNIKGVAAGVFKTKKVEFDKSKMVVLTAGTNGQFSNAYMQKGQRLFSYFVTKALINRPTLDINSLYQEVSVGVKDESFKLGDNKRQEPQIEGNVEMGL
ncbi:MAG: caspase family protein [Arcobacteraceae bacterium]|nr:caspase family protein [Arcobacteraceae bacterium]